MASLHKIRAVGLSNYVDVAQRLGIDPFKMLRDAKISPQLLADPENWLPASSVVDLLEASAKASGCRTFGLLLAQYRSFESLGPISVLFQNVGSVREMAETGLQYGYQLNDFSRAFIDEDADSILLRIVVIPEYRLPQFVELATCVVHRALKAVSRGIWKPEEVHFCHAAPTEVSLYWRAFECPVLFESVFDGFVVTESCLDEHWPWANPALAQHAHRLLRMLPGGSREQVSDRANWAVETLLPKGLANCESVAQALGLSSRTLQRRLKCEGLNFTDLLNRTRRQLALSYLDGQKLSISEIAHLTGFSSTSSFSRWFVTEVGITPRAWRAQQRSTGQNTREPAELG